jgi:2-iminobutanoate/2-iminopropanoate deaminase
MPDSFPSPLRPVSSADAPKAIGPYSQATVVDAPGPVRTIYCSGQISLDPKTGEMIAGGVAAETERVMENLKAVLAAAGAGFQHVVKTTVYLVDMADFARMNEVYARFFPSNPPARATVQVAALPKGARVEIDCVAVA